MCPLRLSNSAEKKAGPRVHQRRAREKLWREGGTGSIEVRGEPVPPLFRLFWEYLVQDMKVL